ncbi:hypothetical protein PUN28_004485 [Cardiocondyla obscurior]|uniref:Uncharacterized protein n=1 Tax=Cardiocondyla obscurior TaxID=286306 RepID=A0AAW2GDW9_9HYME
MHLDVLVTMIPRLGPRRLTLTFQDERRRTKPRIPSRRNRSPYCSILPQSSSSCVRLTPRSLWSHCLCHPGAFRSFSFPRLTAPARESRRRLTRQLCSSCRFFAPHYRHGYRKFANATPRLPFS